MGGRGRGPGPVVGAEEALVARCAELDEQVRRLRRELDEARAHLVTARAQLVDQARLVSLGRLVAGVAHELNNPANFVYGGSVALAERLERWPEPARGPAFDELLRLAGVVRTGGERVRDQIRTLLSFSRPGGPEREVFCLAEAARSALALLEPWARRRGVDVVSAIEPCLALPVEGSRGEVGQVLVNLLTNGVQAAASTVRVSAAELEAEAAVVVRDDGPGVAPALAERIFDAFVTTKREGEGTGLGLAISRSIARSLGGRLELAEAGSPGATFTFALPRAKKEDMAR